MKNFFVSTESVKNRDSGLAGYRNYLSMKQHPNHEMRTNAIYDIYGKNSFKNMLINTFKYENNEGHRRLGEGLRGRYKLDSFAQSFVLSVPKINDLNIHIRPTKDQWKNIFLNVFDVAIKNILVADKCKSVSAGVEAKYGDLTVPDFAEVTFANVHEQVEGNDHLNVVIGKIVNGKIVKEITQKRFLETIKMEFTKSLAKHCKLSINNYKPVNISLPKKRNRVAKQHSLFNREMQRMIAAEYGNELLKPLRNYINNFENGNLKKSEQWLDAFEQKRTEIYQKNVEMFNNESALNIDSTLIQQLDGICERAKIAGVKTPSKTIFL